MMKISIRLVLAIYCLKLVNGLLLLHTWTQLDFLYPDPRIRRLDQISGTFIPGNCVPMDVDVQYLKNGPSTLRMTFITIPRFREGVPASLGTVFQRKHRDIDNPPIAPFPRWEWHQNPELCKEYRLVSVIRIQIDQCGRLWALDSGRINGKMRCPPQVLVFQMTDYVLLKKYEIPREQYHDDSLFVTIAVESLESEGSCSSNPFAYIADSRDNSLIVYDYVQNESWLIKHKSFNPIEGFQYVLGDEEFYSKDGLTGLAVSSPDKGKSFLYYYPLVSNEQSRVETEFLKNRTRFINNASSSSDIFETFPNRVNVQRSSAAFNSKGNVLYFCSLTDSSIKYWKTWDDFNASNILTMFQSNTLQYPSGMKIIKATKRKDELYVLSNRLQKYINGSLNEEEINFRIQYNPYL